MFRLLPTLAFLLTIGFAAHAQSVAELDAKYGFRDLKFETDTSAIEGRERVSAEPLKYVATRPADSRKIGGATLNTIEYSFYQGRLYEVTIIAKGLVNSKALREALEDSFGKGELVSAAGQNRNWKGKLVRLTYREDPAFHNSTVRFTSLKLEEQLKAAKKVVKKAASDL